MAVQEADKKQLIDVGEIGNASTGDILFDGGEKINAVFDQLYNTFGDERLFKGANNGALVQKLYATGYYQKTTKAEWVKSVEMGSMRDIDTSDGDPLRIVLSAGKVGEGVVFINSNGSLNKAAYAQIQVNGSFVNVPSGDLMLTTPFTRTTIWCISTEGGNAVWDYSIESMFGNKIIPLDRTFNLSSTKREIILASHGQFQTMKLLCTCQSSDFNISKVKVSEIMLYTDFKERKVYSTEYAVIRKGAVDTPDEQDELYELTFKYDNSDNIVAVASSPTQNMQLAIKVIATQSIGVPL